MLHRNNEDDRAWGLLSCLVFNSFHTLWRSCYHSVSYVHKGLPSAVGCSFMINTTAADLSSRGTMCVSIAPTHGAWPERRKWQHLSWLSSGCKHHRRHSIYKFKSELLWRSNDKKAPASYYNLFGRSVPGGDRTLGYYFLPCVWLEKDTLLGTVVIGKIKDSTGVSRLDVTEQFFRSLERLASSKN